MADRLHLAGNGFQIDFLAMPAYLRAHVHGGHDSLEVSMGYWCALAETCDRLQATRLLVVEDLPPWEAAEDDFELLMEMGVGLGMDRLQIAFTSLRAPVSVNELGLIVGLEKGMWVRVFASERDADLWLRYGARERDG